MKNSNLEVALVKECCPACTKEMDGSLVMNTRLTPGEAKKVKELHGKVVGFAKNFCEECLKLAEQGIIFIGVDESKTEDMRNPWRTGLFVVVKEDVVKNIVSDSGMLESILKKRMTYISQDVAEAIGLINRE